MVEWTSLITLIVLKKYCGCLLRVWAKIQWRLKCFEKIFKFFYENRIGKLTFYPFSFKSFWSFAILYTSGTYNKIFFWGGGCRNLCTFPLVLNNLFVGKEILPFYNNFTIIEADCVCHDSLQHSLSSFVAANRPTFVASQHS